MEEKVPVVILISCDRRQMWQKENRGVRDSVLNWLQWLYLTFAKFTRFHKNLWPNEPIVKASQKSLCKGGKRTWSSCFVAFMGSLPCSYHGPKLITRTVWIAESSREKQHTLEDIISLMTVTAYCSTDRMGPMCPLANTRLEWSLIPDRVVE